VAPNSFDQYAEYGPSTFDITHMFNGFWVWELPFKTGHRMLKHLVNDWEFSGVFTARSGDPLVVAQGSQVWGGSLYLGFNSGAIPTVNPLSFSNSVQRNATGSSGIGTNSDPANRGTGLNMFPDPAGVYNSFRRAHPG
jgi:hypothetical protein